MKLRFNIVSIKKIKTNKEKESNPTALCDRDFFFKTCVHWDAHLRGACARRPLSFVCEARVQQGLTA